MKNDNSWIFCFGLLYCATKVQNKIFFNGVSRDIILFIKKKCWTTCHVETTSYWIDNIYEGQLSHPQGSQSAVWTNLDNVINVYVSLFVCTVWQNICSLHLAYNLWIVKYLLERALVGIKKEQLILNRKSVRNCSGRSSGRLHMSLEGLEGMIESTIESVWQYKEILPFVEYSVDNRLFKISVHWNLYESSEISFDKVQVDI